MTVLGRHLEFVEALRNAGIPVSLTEDLDAVRALTMLPWHDRGAVRAAYATTLVKRRLQRPAFDALFDLFYPERIGDGAPGPDPAGGAAEKPTGDNLDVLETMRRRIERALRESTLDDSLLRQLAAESVGRFGADPNRAAGSGGWSMYSTLQQLDVQGLTRRLCEAFLAAHGEPDDAETRAQARMGVFVTAVAADIERRSAERRPVERRASELVRPALDQLPFSDVRQADLLALRREIEPLARRLATRLHRERRSQGRGPLDFRRTMRAAMATGGVPMTTRHRPRRPHRAELVVLCDVSGSVAEFARFTLMFVFALREVFQSLRAFTFVDDLAEVTDRFGAGADASDVMAELIGSTRDALLNGRSDYGRVFGLFDARHADALTPKTTLLILGDGRSNYSPLGEEALREMRGRVKHAYWLNPEPRHIWGLGDSAAPAYSELVEMVECRTLEQLSDFVHDLL